MKRIAYLDVVKCFAMYLCICGHMIQNGSLHDCNESWTEDNLFLFIYSFHMPLFTLVSGIFYNSVLSYSLFETVKKKIRQILIPGWAWGIITILYVFIMKEFNIEPNVTRPGIVAPFWFLTMLFLSYIWLSIFFKIIKNKYLASIISLVLLILIPHTDYCHFNSLYPFFIVGYLLRDYFINNHQEKIDGCIFFVSLLVYILMFKYFSFESTMYVTPLKLTCTGGIVLNNFSSWIFRFFIGLYGSLMIISLCKVITLNNDCFIINKLGSVTLGVYVMQSPVVEIIYNVSPINNR